MTSDLPPDDGDMRNVYLTPEEAHEKFKKAIEYLDEFYRKDFDPEVYLPLIKDGMESTMNLLQFAINYVNAFPDTSSIYRSTMTIWCMQAAFWLGYQEGKIAREIQLPPGFYDVLGEIDKGE